MSKIQRIVLLIIFISLNAFSAQDEAPITGEGREPFSIVSNMPDVDATNAQIQKIRNDTVIELTQTYIKSRALWYLVGNTTELVSQVCYVLCPILAGASAGFNNTDIAAAASIVGSIGIGLGKLSKFAHKESRDQAELANKIIEKEGISPIPGSQSTVSS